MHINKYVLNFGELSTVIILCVKLCYYDWMREKKSLFLSFGRRQDESYMVKKCVWFDEKEEMGKSEIVSNANVKVEWCSMLFGTCLSAIKYASSSFL